MENCRKSDDAELTTFLVHPDLSRRDIFVDESGTPIALLDWENIELWPRMFYGKPDFLDREQDEDEPPDGESYRCRIREASDDTEDREKLTRHKEWYTRNLDNYQCTVLREVYYTELRKLDVRSRIWGGKILLTSNGN